MSPSQRPTAMVCGVFFLLAGCAAVGAEALGPATSSRVSIQHLDTMVIPTGARFKGSEIGGISGIAYDPEAAVYHLLSDDRSEHGPARFFTATIDTEKLLTAGDFFQIIGLTTLKKEDGTLFPRGAIDPEGIVIHANGELSICSEGNAERGIAPFVNRFSADGQQIEQLPIDQKYLPTKKSGIRKNLAFESLTLSPDGITLVTGTENGLIQDGPKADLDTRSIARIVVYDLPATAVRAEYGYPVAAVNMAPLSPDQSRTNGLVELLALDNHGSYLALERAATRGRGIRVKLYEISTAAAKDVKNIAKLADGQGRLLIAEEALVDKTELLDFAKDLKIIPDNLEAMCFGPALGDGSRLMIVVSDNNFNRQQATQFLFFKVQLAGQLNEQLPP